MQASWETQLLEKLAAGNSAPLYIIRPPSDGHFQLRDWHQNFLVNLLGKTTGLDSKAARERLKWGHPDLPVLAPASPGQNYKIEDADLAPLFSAQAHRPLELPQRLISILDAECIPERYANKMLKTLEEPRPDTSIFLLVGGQRPLLSTIESRAITLRLPSERPQTPPLSPSLSESRQQWFEREWKERTQGKIPWPPNPLRFHALVDTLKKNFSLQKTFVEMVIDWHRTPYPPAANKSAILEELRWFARAEAFHNSPSERLIGLIHTTFGPASP